MYRHGLAGLNQTYTLPILGQSTEGTKNVPSRYIFLYLDGLAGLNQTYTLPNLVICYTVSSSGKYF